MINLLLEKLREYYTNYSLTEFQDILYNQFVGIKTPLNHIFQEFEWSLNDEDENKINPTIMSIIFEDMIEQKQTAAFYTPKNLTNFMCHDILEHRDPLNTKVLDPSCGAGNFILNAFHYMFDKAKQNETTLSDQQIKIHLIENCLYGVDIMPEAAYTTKLRLKLSVLQHGVYDKEIRFNIKSGNALIGLLEYKPVGLFGETDPNEILLYHFKENGIKYDEYTKGKSSPRDLTVDDIKKLNPFHWGIEFNTKFDVILMNPPWKKIERNHKEFFMKYHDKITKNTMLYKEFEAIKDDILKDENVSKIYDEYLSSFNHVTKWFKCHPALKIVDKIGENNLYKLFMILSLSLLKDDGECSALIPAGIYTDITTKEIRDKIMKENRLVKIIGFINKNKFFKDVDTTFKFCIFHYKKGGTTEYFNTSFDNRVIDTINEFNTVTIDFIKKSSPISHTVMEIKNKMEMQIVNKLLKFPLLGDIDEI